MGTDKYSLHSSSTLLLSVGLLVSISHPLSAKRVYKYMYRLVPVCVCVCLVHEVHELTVCLFILSAMNNEDEST